ncbi:hypothetical protein ALI22I_43190 [Saccharothrix sp. ALI-22-I]|uniref:hypothetical protein n=1 Tax=Saccharothrix sp. ALI-22-I TaxID=1933778 RepID=UPI00097C7AE8|nr:hypothetical protein [Saccharothrix sp. ALI-22-I]ONI80198.1 hypothetical protein ALI22I_43190 [Saccharothrix sp. ALI-22-I]
MAIQRAAIQIGLRDPDEQRLAEVREQMLAANRRTEQLIDGLLVLARSDRGLADRVPVDLDEVVRKWSSNTGRPPPPDRSPWTS